jgi:phospholipid/cholesterol/gamma-HCH transport system permease protein
MGSRKPFAFGLILSTSAASSGLRTTGGTQGVGVSTTQSVVAASVMILISDFFMTKVLLLVVPGS